MRLTWSLELDNALYPQRNIRLKMNEELLSELEEIQKLLSECKTLVDSALVLGDLHEGTASLIGKHLSTLNQRFRLLHNQAD